MGTVILSTLISLDGRINGTDGGIDSHVVGFEVHQYSTARCGPWTPSSTASG